MNRLFFILSFLMGAIVLLSNYLVQYPINYFNLSSILTYGAFSYPITFLITDLSNRAFGKIVARKIVILGFVTGILLTLFISTNFSDFISIRIAIGSGVAFCVAQNLDVSIFDKFRNSKNWYVAPFISSVFGSVVDTFLFFFIAFYNSGINWIYLSFGDLCIKFIIAVIMLIPFRLLLHRIKDVTGRKKKLV